MSRELSDMIEIATSGWLARSGPVSSDTAGSEVGIAPSRSRPESPCRIDPRSSFSPSQSARMRCAQLSTRSPSFVKPSKRWLRWTIWTPSSLSSRRIPDESVGCATWQARAARPKCRSRASAAR